VAVAAMAKRHAAAIREARQLTEKLAEWDC
jgi:hypothetical protein